MKLIARSLTLIVCLAASWSFADPKPADPATTSDALWKRVEDIIEELKNPKTPPQTGEESVQKLKAGFESLDAAVAQFEAKHPADSRRWKAKFFNIVNAEVRQQVGIPLKGDLLASLKEIISAADADKQIKGEASAFIVLNAGQGIEQGLLTSEAWMKLADAHLSAYPEAELNPIIRKNLNVFKQLNELRSKPVDIKFTAVDGRDVDLAKLRGKVVLVDFWATWCAPCVAEVPALVKAYEKYHDKGFEIVGISLDQDPARLEAFVKESGMAWPQYFDGKGDQNELFVRFGIPHIPTMWLLDKKGMLVTNDALGRVEPLVEKMLKE